MEKTSSYSTDRLSQWLRTFDPVTHNAYPVPLVFNLSNISIHEVKQVKSLFNKMFELARKYNVKIVFSNLIDKIRKISQTCHHMLQSCQPVYYPETDLLQKFTAIENQTKNNHQLVEIVLS